MWVKISVWPTVLDGDKANTSIRLSTVVLSGALAPPRRIALPSLAHCLPKITEGEILRERERELDGGGGGGQLESSSSVFSSQLMY